MPLDASQITFAKDLLRTLRDHHTTIGDVAAAQCPQLGSVHIDLDTNPVAKNSRSLMALEIIHIIESRAPESELWTSSPDATDVTLGDHLYITRKHFGITC